MRPRELNETSNGALAALAQDLFIPLAELRQDLRLVGHSFGCGAALFFAAASPEVKRVALLAPFVALKQAAWQRFGILSWIIPKTDTMDNAAWLAQLFQRSPRPAVLILHGTADNTLPISGSRELAAPYPEWVEFHALPDVGHFDLPDEGAALLDGFLYPETVTRRVAETPVVR
jgi:pimeloyl-ACP methyl ester carboxylesterase